MDETDSNWPEFRDYIFKCVQNRNKAIKIINKVEKHYKTQIINVNVEKTPLIDKDLLENICKQAMENENYPIEFDWPDPKKIEEQYLRNKITQSDAFKILNQDFNSVNIFSKH